jgi:hypothetical protein
MPLLRAWETGTSIEVLHDKAEDDLRRLGGVGAALGKHDDRTLDALAD